MNCSRFETLLSDFMDQSLDPRVQSAMSQHLAGCTECAGLLGEVRLLRDDLASFPTVEPPPQMVSRILERTWGRPKVRSLWKDLILPTVSPFLTQRFAYATVMMFLFFSFMVSLMGPGFSALSYSDLRPSTLIEEADRISSQIYKKWVQFNDYRTRFLEELRLLKEDLYGRLDYHLITILFKSYSESLQEQGQRTELPDEDLEP